MSLESAAQNPQAASQLSDQGPGDLSEVVGSIDSITGNRVHGWAFDPSHPDEKLDVEIRFDDRPIQTVRADRFRDGLKQGGIGDGAHGFSLELPAQLSSEDYRRISATVRRNGQDGVVRLRNEAAANTNGPASGPSEFTDLMNNMARCVEEQRAGFRWIHKELQTLEQLVRDNARSGPPPATAQEPAAAAAINIAAASFEPQLSDLAQNQTVIHEVLEEMTAFQQSLNKRLEQFEVINARIDARLGELEKTGDSNLQDGDNQKGLKRLILFLGCLTATSLIVGIIALVM